VDFTPEAFNTLISEKGYDVLWEKMTHCSWRSPQDPTRHDINCGQCDNGWFYYDPRTIRVALMGLNRSQSFMQQGMIQHGSAQMVTASENEIGFFDRITLLNSYMRFAELVVRTSGVDSPRYPAIKLLDVRDKSRAYTQGTDFKLSSGKIEWLGGAGPSANVTYSVSYNFNPVYVITDLPHDIRDTPKMSNTSWPRRQEDDRRAKMPAQAVITLHFFARGEQGKDT
jgi:hypothetical protein